MRPLALLLITTLFSPLAAVAQEPPAEAMIDPPPPPTSGSPQPAPAADRPLLRRSLPPGMAERWHRGRVLYGVGSVMGLVGSGLTLSSVLIVIITGYPCNPDDPIHAINPNDSCNRSSASFKPSKPTDAAPLLAYIGSGASSSGFLLSAVGLGYQHQLLGEMQADTGRGPFIAGTTLGLLGFVGVGFSYFFGFTKYLNPHDQGIAILTSSITGTVLCSLGGLLYTIDESRMNKIWRRLSTF